VAFVVRLKSIACPSSAARAARTRSSLEHGKVEQRLAAEKRQMCATCAALLEQEIDAVARRLLRHELRLPAVLGVDDLVLAVLVAIRARQVALVVTFITIVVSGILPVRGALAESTTGINGSTRGKRASGSCS
jgi:hypothetical protein